MLLFDNLSDLVDLVVVQFANFGIEVHAGGAENLIGLRTSNAVNVGQADLDPLIRRKIHARNTCHLIASEKDFEIRIANFEFNPGAACAWC